MNNYNPGGNKSLHWNVFLYSSWAYIIGLLVIELIK